MDYRDRAIELVDDGMVDPMMMLTACLTYMSQDEVKDMLTINELLDEDEDEDDFEDDGQPDSYTEYQDLYGGDDAFDGEYL